jgi:hypothetical protein
MGSGSWSSRSFNNYVTTAYNVSDAATFTSSNYSVNEIYTQRRLADCLNPYKVIRACHDNAEHPETLPVILALDVTGSMGGAAVKVRQKLNEIMTQLYDSPNVKDIEFCIMGIGDLWCDNAPIQMSQFESDIRIMEQSGEIYFEAGGGGNTYESYTAAWYMGARHTDLHCWKRGKKGIIITLGDECPNPVLERAALHRVVGDNLEADVKTIDLYSEVTEKFNVFHIAVDDRETSWQYHRTHFNADGKWKELLGENFYEATLDSLSNTIVNIIEKCATANNVTVGEEVIW